MTSGRGTGALLGLISTFLPNFVYQSAHSALFILFLCVSHVAPKSLCLCFPCSHGSGPPFCSLVPSTAALVPCWRRLSRESRTPLIHQPLNSSAVTSAQHEAVSHMYALSVAKICGNSICRELWDFLWQLPGLLAGRGKCRDWASSRGLGVRGGGTAGQVTTHLEIED